MDDPDLTEADLEKLKFCGQSFINTIVTTNANIVKFKAGRGTRAFDGNIFFPVGFFGFFRMA